MKKEFEDFIKDASADGWVKTSDPAEDGYFAALERAGCTLWLTDNHSGGYVNGWFEDGGRMVNIPVPYQSGFFKQVRPTCADCGDKLIPFEFGGDLCSLCLWKAKRKVATSSSSASTKFLLNLVEAQQEHNQVAVQHS